MIRSSFPAATAAEILPRMIAWRRALHRRPEVGLELPETVAFVCTELQSLGLSPQCAGHGVSVDVGHTGPLVAIRADMDALALQEESVSTYASEKPGLMHACGHDAHTAALLGSAALLAATPDLPFRARLLFQAGEEGHFGAQALIAAGCLDGVAAIVGAHVGDLVEGLEPGQAGFLAGPTMAASDKFRAAFVGRGGHASAPHRASDPIPALAQYALALGGLRSRELDPREPALIAVTQVTAGTAHNIIPRVAQCQGTVRTFREETRQRIAVRVRELGASFAAAHGLEFELDYTLGYPALVNHPEATACAAAAAREVLGSERVVGCTAPSLAAEDFASYLERVPGCFWFLNTQSPSRGIDEPNHSPTFDIDENLLGDLALVNTNAAALLAARFG